DRLRWHVPPGAHAAGAQIRGHMDGEITGGMPPAQSQHQCHQQEREGTLAQGLDMGLKMGDLVLEPAHGDPLRVVQYPDRVTRSPPPPREAVTGYRSAIRH